MWLPFAKSSKQVLLDKLLAFLAAWTALPTTLLQLLVGLRGAEFKDVVADRVHSTVEEACSHAGLLYCFRSWPIPCRHLSPQRYCSRFQISTAPPKAALSEHISSLSPVFFSCSFHVISNMIIGFYWRGFSCFTTGIVTHNVLVQILLLSRICSLFLCARLRRQNCRTGIPRSQSKG